MSFFKRKEDPKKKEHTWGKWVTTEFTRKINIGWRKSEYNANIPYLTTYSDPIVEEFTIQNRICSTCGLVDEVLIGRELSYNVPECA